MKKILIGLLLINTYLLGMHKNQFSSQAISDYHLSEDGNDAPKNIVDKKIAAIVCCGISLGCWPVALNHIGSRHKVIDRYACYFCNIRYWSSTKALECFLQHRDSTIFTCSLCGIAYKSRQSLIDHVCTMSGNFLENDVIEQNPSNIYSQPNILSIPVASAYRENNSLLSTSSITNRTENNLFYNFSHSSNSAGNTPQTPFTAMLYANSNTSHLNSNSIPTPIEKPANQVIDVDNNNGMIPMTPFTEMLYRNSNTPQMSSNSPHEISSEKVADQIHTNNQNNKSIPQTPFTTMLYANISTPQLNSDSLQPQESAELIVSCPDSPAVSTPLVLRIPKSSSAHKTKITIEDYVFDASQPSSYNSLSLTGIIQKRINSKHYSCCDLKNVNWEEFCKHQREKHSEMVKGEKHIKCSHCNKSLKNHNSMYEHIAWHSYPSLFECPLCSHAEKKVNHEYKMLLNAHFKKCIKQTLTKNNSSTLLSVNTQSNNTNQIMPIQTDRANDWIELSVNECRNIFSSKN